LLLQWLFVQCNYEDASLLSIVFLLRMHHLQITMPLLWSDAYLEQLRKDVAMAEQGNQKVSGEISVTAETTFNGWFVYLPCFSFLSSGSLLG
jgi:hypothetical protein